MPAPDPRQEAVLVLAPTGRDARLIVAELARHGFAPLVCESLDQLCAEIRTGGGVALLAEEALPPAGLAGLVDALGRQPPWSDLPLLILTGKGAPSSGSIRRFEALEPVANVTQLERPVRARTLMSAVRSALRARRRQYDVRDHLAERERLLREGDAERARLAEVFARAPSFMAVLRGPDHVFERANDRYLDLVGRGRDLIGRPVREALPEVNGQGYFETMDRVFRTGEPFTESAARILLDRGRGPEERVLEFVYQPLRDAAGRVSGIVANGVDLTDRERAEEQLRASEERYRTLFTSMDEGYCVIQVLFDPAAPGRAVDYLFLEVNPAFEAQAGMRDAVGRRMLEFVPSIEEHWLASYGRVALTGEPIRFANEYKTLHRWFDVYAFRVGPPDAHRVAVLFTDITGRRRAEAERERLVEQLKEADRRKDEFLALLAHELRNPLAPLRNGLQVIRLSADRDACERAQAMMDRQLGHMVRLIDDLLDVSRVSRNKMELRRTRLPLADVVASAVETVRPAIDAAGHELTVSLPPRPLYLDADLTRLAQVFGNLLSNSAKYTPPGGRIRLTAEARGGQAVVTVSDTGIGIPADSLPNIFDMFSQVDRSIERSTGGLGIGLALVKGLVEMHGGTIAAASDGQGAGSVFTVRLPLMEPPPPTGRAADNGVAVAPTAGRRILVVDDNRDGAESLAMMLRLMGNEVSLAHDGVEAVEAAGRVRPEVILMDVGMPRLNGLDATRRIREQPWGRAVTIVALTGWGQEDDRERSRAAGCDGHLVKPVAVEDLSRLLATLRA